MRSTRTNTGTYRDDAEIPSASSIGDGPGVGRKFSKTRVTKFGSVLNMIPYMDRRFFARRTLPPIAWPATIILVRSGRVVTWIGRHSSFEIRPGTLCRLSLCMRSNA